MQEQSAPIGYWLKRADEALTDGINAIQASYGLTRTDWQILNALQEQPSCSLPELMQLMQPFAGPVVVERVLTRFAAAGFFTSGDEFPFRLTQEGHALHLACWKTQQAFRQTARSGITDEAYQTTVVTLRQLVQNLTPDQP